MRFVAIDVETANADVSTICQIGLAAFDEDKLVDEWSTLVDPESHFDAINTAIHGIEAGSIIGKPRLPQVAKALRNRLDGAIIVSHSHFDRIAVARAFERYKLEPLSVQWLDSTRVVRRAWKDVAWKGYGLASLCRRIGYQFQHHDALEDAKAAGYVLVAAIKDTQVALNEWLQKVNDPIDGPGAARSADIARDGNPEGDLYGEVVVFTGALLIPRSEAASLAASVGCRVDERVTKKTTILVVGDQDVTKLAGYEKSSRHRKAEQLVAEGQSIRIVRESDFQALSAGRMPG